MTRIQSTESTAKSNLGVILTHGLILFPWYLVDQPEFRGQFCAGMISHLPGKAQQNCLTSVGNKGSKWLIIPQDRFFSWGFTNKPPSSHNHAFSWKIGCISNMSFLGVCFCRCTNTHTDLYHLAHEYLDINEDIHNYSIYI